MYVLYLLDAYSSESLHVGGAALPALHALT